jgi:predicted proteasome-type protease
MSDTIRINITVSKKLLDELKKDVKKGDVSNFFEQAVEEKLKKDRINNAWQQLLEIPPLFEEVKDPVEWVRELRKTDDKRLKNIQNK